MKFSLDLSEEPKFATKLEKALTDSAKQFRKDKVFYRQQLDKKVIDRKQ